MDIQIFKLHTNGCDRLEAIFVGWPSVAQIHKVLIDYYDDYTDGLAETLYKDGDAPIPGHSRKYISIDFVEFEFGE